MNGWDMNGWGWGWMVVMMTIGTLLVALLVITMIRGTTPGPQSSREEDPANVLALRLARGEINEEEYQRRKELLQSRHTSSTS